MRKLTLYLALIIAFLSPAAAAEAPKLVFEEPIATGARRYEYSWKLPKGKVLLDVVRCDLTKPDLKVDLVTGRGKYTQKATVSQMANRTGAVALVNGDFFNMKAQGAPLGASVRDGILLSAPMNSIGYYTLGIDDRNTASILQVTFGGHLIGANGKKYPLQGVNKAQYWDNITGAHSHTDTIHVYTDHWNSKSRGKVGDTAVEILVGPKGKVEDVSIGKTLGYQVPQGKMILQGNGKGAEFIRKNVKKGDRVTVNYQLYPKKNWKMLIGGHGLLVNDGLAVPYLLAPEAIAGNRPRTAAGISKDGKTLWIVAAERSRRSKGLQLSELSQFMVFLGTHKALNFDGGGSTAMSVASTGELKPSLKIKPEGGGPERYVVNGLGVYNTAKEGPLTGLKVVGRKSIMMGETYPFGVRGWDANYVAKDMAALPVAYSDDVDGQEYWSGNKKTFLKKGKRKITVAAEGVKGSMDVSIEGANAIAKMIVTSDKKRPKAGEVVTLSTKVKTKAGRTVDIDPRVMNYTLEGYEGEVIPGKGQIKITSTDGVLRGKIQADLDGYRRTLTMVNPDARHIHMNVGKTAYLVDGKAGTMDVKPVIIKNRTMVPLRFLVEALGGEVSWNPETRTVTVNYRGTVIQLPVGAMEITVNGAPVTVDSPATIREDRTLIPIRFVTESLGMIVEYEDKTRGVDIYELPGEVPAPKVEKEPLGPEGPKKESLANPVAEGEKSPVELTGETVEKPEGEQDFGVENAPESSSEKGTNSPGEEGSHQENGNQGEGNLPKEGQ